MIKLTYFELIENQDIDIEVPHELTLEDHELASVNDVAVKCLHDLDETSPSQVSCILSGEQGRASLRAFQMVSNLTLLRLTWERFLHFSLDHAHYLDTFFAKSDLA